MGSLLIVTGPPGAGKSTVAQILVEQLEPSVLVEGDAFFAMLRRGAIEPWLPESNDQNAAVTEAMARATGRFAIAFETVFDGIVGPWFLPTFMAAADVDELDYVVLLPEVERCVQRVHDRIDHEFSDGPATRKMHAEFSGTDLDPRHVVTLAGGPESLAAEVTRRRVSGSLVSHRP